MGPQQAHCLSSRYPNEILRPHGREFDTTIGIVEKIVGGGSGVSAGVETAC